MHQRQPFLASGPRPVQGGGGSVPWDPPHCTFKRGCPGTLTTRATGLSKNSAEFAVLKQLSVRCENGNLEQKM